MKVLVTGGTGFIGNYVIEHLLNSDIKVLATSTSIEKAKTKHWFKDVTYVPYEINSKINENLFEYFDTPDKIIHLAWKGLPNYSEPFHLNENLPNDFKFLQNLIDHGAKDISIAGTCFEYGMQNGCLDESMYAFPNNYYALAKDTLRKSLELYQNKKSFDMKWIRLFYMYGDSQYPNSLIAQLERAIELNENSFNMSGGEQLRDYLHVSIVAENIVKIALQDTVKGIINNCSGVPISVKDFVVKYLTDRNKNIHLNLGFHPYSEFEPMEFWGNNTILKKIQNEYNLQGT